MGKYWGNTLKTADSSQRITCPPRFGFLKGEFHKEKTWPTRKRLVLQGKDLGYKEKRQDLTTIKTPTPPHIKVRIIDPSLAL